jgi:hypothetical protein
VEAVSAKSGRHSDNVDRWRGALGLADHQPVASGS